MRDLVIHELLEDAVRLFPNAQIVSGHNVFTYSEFHERVLRLANGLTALGVKPGTVVGVLDVNSHRFLELQYATSYLGAVIHPLNFRLPAEQLVYTIRHASDEWLFAWAGFGDTVVKLADTVNHFVLMPDAAVPIKGDFRTYESIIEQGEPRVPETAEHVSQSDIYTTFYTTGTTGRPKGLRYRHRDLTLAPIQMAHHLALRNADAKLGYGDVLMPNIPFFHIHAWGAAFAGPYLGAKIVLPERADAATQVQLITSHHVTWSNMVPTQLHLLLDAAEKQGVKLPLKVLTGGSALPAGLARRAIQAGISYSLIYGGSDQLATCISGSQAEALEMRMSPLPLTRLELRSESNDLVAQDGVTIGELFVQSPWLPGGYVQDEERSHEVYQNGWFRTGDLGVWFSDGTVRVIDRLKDAVKSGGEWIPTTTVESILSELDGVACAAVIAMQNPQWGERPLAILEASKAVSEGKVREHMLQAVQEKRLAKFWLPDRYEFVSTIPLTSAGKVDKVALRKKFA